MTKTLLALLAVLSFNLQVQAQSSTGPTEGTGPVSIFIVVDPDFVGLAIESPMINYGVTSDLVIPAENYGVPGFDDYNDLRDEISDAIDKDIDGIKASVGSLFAFANEAGCRYDEGSESIFKRDGEWIVTFDIEFACRQKVNLKSVSINLFDLAGFSDRLATVINGYLEATVEIDGINRSVDLW